MHELFFLTSRSAVSVHINIDLWGVMLGSDLIHVLCLCQLSLKAIGPHEISRMQWVALKINSVKDHISYAMLVCVRERERHFCNRNMLHAPSMAIQCIQSNSLHPHQSSHWSPAKWKRQKQQQIKKKRELSVYRFTPISSKDFCLTISKSIPFHH